MKKIILTTIILLISLTMFAQRYDTFFRVATDTTPFGRNLPANTLVYCVADTNLYVLTALTPDSLWLAVAPHTDLPHSSGVAALFDSNHCYTYFKVDSIASCSPLILSSTDSIIFRGNVVVFDSIVRLKTTNNYPTSTTFLTTDANGNIGYVSTDSLTVATDTTWRASANEVYLNSNFNKVGINKMPDNALDVNGDIGLTGKLIVKNIPLSASDSVLVIDNDTIKYKLGKAILPDSALYSDNSGLLNGVDTNYLLNKYWNRTNDSITTNYNAYVNGNFSSTNGNFIARNHDWFCGYDTIYEGVLKFAGVGKLKGSLLTGTYITNSFAYIENTDITFFGFDRKVGGVTIKGSYAYADSNTLELSRGVNNRKLRITLSDTAIITEIPSKTIMSADSGGNHFKIYVPTITNNLTVHGTITSGGLINKDTVITLLDDATFNFPNTSVGWAEIQCDSLLKEKTWGNVSWNGDGSINPIRNNGAKFVSTNTDGNEACFYDGGTYAILRNTSGYTRTYSIKYHYHY